MATKAVVKKATPYSKVLKALSAVRQGKVGATEKAKKAIKEYAQKSCKIKAVKNTKHKQVVAKVGKKRSATKRK